MQKQVAADEHLRGRVLFPGMLSGDSKWGAFYGAEAFILPSHQENFGIAVVEALACGKPTLISNQVNIWREIETAGGGLVADDTPAGTHMLLATWQATAPHQKAAMSMQAQEVFKAKFATRPAALRLLQALEQ
jgi:glycosyltransferase involved in cell wall biosynthesis